MKLILHIVILFAPMHLAIGEVTLPPEKLRAEWGELEALGFSEWRIKIFNGWAVPFDGGSKVFFFQSHSGKTFDVVVANPTYWTKEDRKARRQVFYLIHNKRFYRVKEDSDEEATLISMLQAARPELAGTGKKDPKLIEQLVERIKSRKPMFKPSQSQKFGGHQPATR